MTQPFPSVLTPRPCNCGSPSCKRIGFDEGTFYQGTGFDEPLATEIARRYEQEPKLRALITQMKELLNQ